MVDSIGPIAALRVLARVTEVDGQDGHHGDDNDDNNDDDNCKDGQHDNDVSLFLPSDSLPPQFFASLLSSSSSSSSSEPRRRAFDSALEKFDAHLWKNRPREILPDCAATLLGGTRNDDYDDNDAERGETNDRDQAPTNSELSATFLAPHQVPPEDAATHWGVFASSTSLIHRPCRGCGVELGFVVSNADKRVVICACGCVFHRPCLIEACAESGEAEEECPFC